MSQPDARAHLLAVAQMLAEISSEMEALGEALCHDPDFAARHMVELQAIDLISQKQRSLASLLEADCPVSAVAQVGLEDVAQRLQRLSANG
ncbi:MAG TPA: hypothetical protein PKE25_12915 [Novosphingobium sp.]|nr:hypothetical protein [Novosphingobium sp.]